MCKFYLYFPSAIVILLPYYQAEISALSAVYWTIINTHRERRADLMNNEVPFTLFNTSLNLKHTKPNKGEGRIDY